MKRPGSTDGPPVEALLNLARYHREHEKYYAIAPLRDAEVILYLAYPQGARRPLERRRAPRVDDARPCL